MQQRYSYWFVGCVKTDRSIITILRLHVYCQKNTLYFTKACLLLLLSLSVLQTGVSSWYPSVTPLSLPVLSLFCSLLSDRVGHSHGNASWQWPVPSVRQRMRRSEGVCVCMCVHAGVWMNVIYIYIYIYICMQRISDGTYALIHLEMVCCANVNARRYELCLCLCWIERKIREEINAFDGRERWRKKREWVINRHHSLHN